MTFEEIRLAALKTDNELALHALNGWRMEKQDRALNLKRLLPAIGFTNHAALEEVRKTIRVLEDELGTLSK